MFNKNSSINIIKAEKGFTLIELLIVVTIIGILAAIAIPSYIGTQEKARRSNLVKAVRSAESDLQNWINSALKGSVPISIGALLTEVDTDWNGTVQFGVDLTNNGLFNIAGVANMSVASCYAAARTAQLAPGGSAQCGQVNGVAEMSPWAGMSAGCAATQTLYEAMAVPAPALPNTPAINPCRVVLHADPASVNSIIAVASSNGPGGTDDTNAEELTRKMVTAE